jgi:hypothetical protein
VLHAVGIRVLCKSVRYFLHNNLFRNFFKEMLLNYKLMAELNMTLRIVITVIELNQQCCLPACSDCVSCAFQAFLLRVIRFFCVIFYREDEGRGFLKEVVMEMKRMKCKRPANPKRRNNYKSMLNKRWYFKGGESLACFSYATDVV